MSIRSLQLELTGHWICLSLDISSLSDYGARVYKLIPTCSQQKASVPRRVFRFSSIIFQLFPFSKTFKQHNGCHTHKIFIMDDEGRKLVQLHCSEQRVIKDIEQHF